MFHSHRWIFLLVILVLTVGYSVAQLSSSATPVSGYPNTAAGLEHLMGDMLSLQKKGDAGALAPYLQSLILPDSEAWFTSKFGNVRCDEQQRDPNDCLGPRMAFTYNSVARVLPASFSMTLTDFLREGLTNFEASNYTDECPGPRRIIAARELVGGLTTTPHLSSVLSAIVQHREPIYVLWVYNESKETTLPFFVYVEGAFRYIGMLHPVSIEEVRKAKAAGDDSRPAPSAHLLGEDQLQMNKVVIDPSVVQRTVVLRVSLNVDGKPKDVTYVRGPETEKESAIQSVRKRKFEKPGFGPGGFHPNVFCLSITGSQ